MAALMPSESVLTICFLVVPVPVPDSAKAGTGSR